MKNVIYFVVFYVYYEMNCIYLMCFLDIVFVFNIMKFISIMLKILVYWSYLNILYYLVFNYEVIWKVNGSFVEMLGFFERIVKEYIIFCYLMVG